LAERESGERASIPITAEGLERLQAELDELRGQRQPEAVRRVRDTREQAADPLESGEYSQAFEELREVDARIAALEEMLDRVELVEAEGGDLIGLGSSIELKMDDGSRETYILVGPTEADPLAARISLRLPLGEALIGRRRGHQVTWDSPEGPRNARVVAVATPATGQDSQSSRRAG
jgi:transcription elongation factor GreA